MSQSVASSCVVDTTVKNVREYLNMVVDEVQWCDRLNHCNHSLTSPTL